MVERSPVVGVDQWQITGTAGGRRIVSETGHNDLPGPWVRRWLLLKATARASATAAVLVTLYFVLPMSGRVGDPALLLLLAGFVVLIAVIAWQVRAIIRSSYPGLRWVQAVVVSIVSLLLMFASVYYVMGQVDPSNFTQHLTRVDALYFTVTTFSTVGFGDISASSQPARIVVIVQIITDLIVLGTVAKLLLGAVNWGRERHQRGDGKEANTHPMKVEERSGPPYSESPAPGLRRRTTLIRSTRSGIELTRGRPARSSSRA